MANTAQQPGGGNSTNTSNSSTSWVQNLFNALATSYTPESVEWATMVEVNNLTGNYMVGSLPATTSNGSSTTQQNSTPHNYVPNCLDDPDLIEALWETEPVAGAPGETLSQSVICSSSASSSQNKNFNFLYNLTPSTNVKRNVVSEELGVYATRVGPNNPYYVGNARGNNCAIVINLLNGLTVPNCVGFAHGRIKEIWGLSVKAGFIKKGSDGKYYIPSQNNRKITGYVNTERNWIPPVIPACDAVKFWDNWPTSEGYSRISADDIKNGAVPQVGSIVCWGEGLSGSARPGHVAVVEQVCNPGLENEFIIVSEAYYGTSSGHIKTIAKNNMYNGKPYSFQWGFTLKGFLVSPVCQLSAVNEINIELIQNPISQGDIEAYQAVTQEILGEHSKVTSQLHNNDKVIISWFGNEKADGTGKRVGHLDAVGTVVNIDRSKEYPYQININNKLAGYYTRTSLETYSNEAVPSTNTTPSSNIPSTAKYKVRLLAQINVRKSYSTLSEKVGRLEYGTIVDVYETKKSEGYTWNKIGSNRWIADDGTWLEKVESPSAGTKYKTLVELHVRKGPGTSYNTIKTLSQGSTVTVTEQCNGADGYIWNKIGYNQWIANDGSWLQKV